MKTEAFEQFSMQVLNCFMTEGALILIILVAMYSELFVLKRLLKRLQTFIERRFPDQAQVQRANTLTNVLGDLVRVLIAMVGMMTILSQLGINLGPLLVAAGVGGIAVGFGAQSLVKDVISGFFILRENQIRVGDVVKIAGVGAS